MCHLTMAYYLESYADIEALYSISKPNFTRSMTGDRGVSKRKRQGTMSQKEKFSVIINRPAMKMAGLFC